MNNSTQSSSVPSSTPSTESAAPAQTSVKVPLPAKLAVGAVAGIIGTCAIFPIDIVKTRLQNQKRDAHGKVRYSGPIHAFRSILKREGLKGLYRGLGANLVGVTPEKAIKLSANDVLREYFTDRNGDGKITISQEVMSGAGAGFVQFIATNPMEIVKIRLQVQGADASIPRLSTWQVVQGLGLKGLYRGSVATLVRDIPFSALFFPLYANLKGLFGKEEGLVTGLVAGCISGAVASGLCTPADVIKTRLQVSGGSKLYSNVWDCAKKVYADEGFAAFYRGVVPRMMVVAPLFGISLVAFDLQKRFMQKQLAKAQETEAAREWASRSSAPTTKDVSTSQSKVTESKNER